MQMKIMNEYRLSATVTVACIVLLMLCKGAFTLPLRCKRF